MVEIFQGRARRRWSEEDKRRLVAETLGPGETVHGVARRRGVSASQLFAWRKRYRPEIGRPVSASRVPGFAAVAVARRRLRGRRRRCLFRLERAARRTRPAALAHRPSLAAAIDQHFMRPV
jgi:transposase